ncbi:MAG TPA: hypothetical protein VHO92_05425 [Methanobacterium sp.]|nr:hypothetical protein [Methanobacterium sp.]
MEDLSDMLEPITVFDKTTDEGCDIKKRYDTYIENIQPILAKYSWFITPSTDFRLWYYISQNISKQADPEDFLNRVFVYFFSVFNFENLNYMVERWEVFSMLDTRFPILKECVNILKDSASKNSNIKNPHYVIIPALIAQIDGLKNDIFEYCKSRKMDFEGRNIDKKSQKINISKLFENRYNPETAKILPFVCECLLKDCTAANDLLFDSLFQTAKHNDKMENLKPPFSRHKIMHGQYLEYGTLENTIRLFLLIDFLAEMKDTMERIKL